MIDKDVQVSDREKEYILDCVEILSRTENQGIRAAALVAHTVPWVFGIHDFVIEMKDVNYTHKNK